ncbi:MAG TPA: glycosyltransferase family 4 protein [Candidatus Acidoferrales bacterium]|nr:glycosyltransferase family 4 protein [Candidatus Acidoferrales bacterium]
MSRNSDIDVCMITSYHDFDDDRIFQKEAKSLVKAGKRVVLLAPADKKQFICDGIQVFGFKRRKYLGRLVTTLQLTVKAFELRAGAYHFHEPELLLAGMFLRIFTRGKIVYDVHEEHATSIPVKVKSPLIRKLVGMCIFALERMLAKVPHNVIVVRKDLADRFARYGCTNITEILVCAPTELFPRREKGVLNSGTVTIVHEGNLDIATRGLDKYLEAARIVRDKIANVHFLTIGRVPPKDLEWMRSFMSANRMEDYFEICSWIRFEELPKILRASSIGILLLQPVSMNNIMGLPNKLFDYMAAGIPTVACNFPNIAEIVSRADCGVLVDPTDPAKIAAGVTFLIENPEEAVRLGKNARAAFERYYNWEEMEKRLLAVYS